MQVALECWREFGTNAELAEAVQKLARRFGPVFGWESIYVRHLSLEERCLVTEAVGVSGSQTEHAAVHTQLSGDQLDQLVRWCADRRLVSCSRERGPLAPGIALPEGVTGRAIVAPLLGTSGPLGVLVLGHTAHREPSAEGLDAAAEMQEPFAAALDQCLRLRHVERERRAMEADKNALLTRLARGDIADTIVGSNTGLKDVIEQVAQVAPTDVPVLILGETGSGKEVIARTIHTRSKRRSGPMFRVNCGAIPPELVDSELFGHERGSFTGAIAARKGWFERADGGTLFMDEIGNLPLAAQVRLLRVLQDGALERVGGQRTVHVDVRVVAATNADLSRMVQGGNFREDLWYRISVFPIRLPPLRERLADIPELASHFAIRAGQRLGGAPLKLTAEDIHLLVGYAWPGNVRELNAVIERAAILGDGKRLELAVALGRDAISRSWSPRSAPSAVPPRPGMEARVGTEASAQGVSGQAGTEAHVGTEAAAETFPTLDEAMVQHIEKALARTQGRVEGPRGAAALLGINPHTLRARMRKLRLDWAAYRR